MKEYYNSIIKKITDIAKDSVLSNSKETVDYSIGNFHFAVLKDRLSELQELLDLENNAYIILNDKSVLKNNMILKEWCKSNQNLVLEQIIFNVETALRSMANGQNDMLKELTVTGGVIVLKQDAEELSSILDTTNINLEKNIDTVSQEERIKDAFSKVSMEETVKNTSNALPEEINNELSKNRFLPIFTLAMLGHLTNDMLSDMRYGMSYEEYNLMLKELYSHNLITNSDLNYIKMKQTKTVSELSSLELATVLSTRDELNIDGIKAFKDILSPEEYILLISTLYMRKVISEEVYNECKSVVDQNIL